jgi:site-specific DNA-cytosine methylase
MRVMELFAGIGGLALALPRGFELVAAFDQDAEAGATHALNHGVPVGAIDLAGACAADLASHEAGAWLLSPPCQPFTRRGLGRDVDDPRCRGLLRLIELMSELRPRRVLVENVVGFHGSRAHERLVAALHGLGHDVACVQDCPSEHGAPIRRPRQFVVSSADGLAPAGTTRDEAAPLDADPSPDLDVPLAWHPKLVGHEAPGLPLPTVTRSYGRAITGAGPILLGPRGPRFLSPEEILRLHAFPRGFRFEESLPLRARWRLAGNAVHVGSVRRILARWGDAPWR